ncbi:BON domain-containing protein [uncultured Nitrosomonas sp.]|uniref:BON domain-containing protein n=1 Tax=uncultured Nitrosomonas sp. TaxID=156424 RepID=UPI0025E6AF21|nr:BON domain-containing protein [uncultured Nitrosomonas sp.]
MQIFLKLFTLVLLLIGIFFLAGCENYAEKTHPSWVTPPPGMVYDDSTIFARVTLAIQSDPVLQGTSIEIKVNEGHVTLTGVARNEDQITRTNMHTWIVDGVKNVDNQVIVKK